MSFKNTPITAKIKRTTQGGITQPLLNVGGPIQMKAPSPNKQTGIVSTLVKQGAKSLLPAVKKSLPAVKKYGKKAANKVIDVTSKTVSNKNTGSGFFNIAKNFVKKNAPAVGYGLLAADVYNSLTGASDDKKEVKPKPEQKKTTTTTTKKGKSWDQAYEDRDKKLYTMDKDSYIKEAKRQKAVHAKTGKWDVKSSYGSKTKPKAKVATTVEAKPASVKSVSTTTTKLDPKEVKAQVTKVNAKQTTKTTKPTKSQKLRAKGNAILADKSLSTEEKQKKALRVRRQYDRTVKRETKKAAKKSTKIKYDETTGTGGSVVGNLVRSISGKRTKDRLKAKKRKGQAAGAIEVK